MSTVNRTAARLRRFNRFYTRRLGLLDARHLQSPFALAEVRVLYEIAHREQLTAAEIGALLGMDAGYLSRLLRRFRQRGLVRARIAPNDGRERWLALTPKGRKAFNALDARATDHMADLIRDLTSEQQQELVGAVTTVEAVLDSAQTQPKVARADAVELRPPACGDLGWVVQRHGELYDREYGWDTDFERLVARIVGEFAAAPSGPRQRCWIATIGGRRAGCVFLMPGPHSDEARLRLLLVEPWARGRRLGTRLVATCIDAARDAGCSRLTLWTNDVLVAARRIYERAGFRLIDRKRHRSFGKSLVGQNWALTL